MMKSPLRAAPNISSSSSVTSTPYEAEMVLEVSATRGMFSLPTPPSSRLVRVHAKCVWWESVEIASTWELMASNSELFSLKEMISVCCGLHVQ